MEEGYCDTRQTYVLLEFEGEPDWFIGCRLEGQLAQFCLSRVASPYFSADTPAWRGMTKLQLWHRLTGSPALSFAKFKGDSHLAVTLGQSKTFAQKAFGFLCRATGVLTIYMSDLQDSCERFTMLSIFVTLQQKDLFSGKLMERGALSPLPRSTLTICTQRLWKYAYNLQVTVQECMN